MALIPYGVTPSTRESARRATRDAQGEGHAVRRVWGFAPWPDHWNRRCVDFMVDHHGDLVWLKDYFVRWNNELHVKYVIAGGMQWRDYSKPGIPRGQWRPYYGVSGHWDHVHVEFWR